MGNNRGRWLLSIFLFTCLIFLFSLYIVPLTYSQFPPPNFGGVPFSGPSPFPGSYAPPLDGGFFPSSGVPYGLPYQDPGLGFAPPAAPYGVPYQNTGLGFAPAAAPYGVPYQNTGLGSTLPDIPFGSFPQTTGFNLQSSSPYGPGLPYIQPTFNNPGSNANNPVFNTGYNPGGFPNQGFFGPVTNMYNPSPVPQPFPGGSPFVPAPAPGFMDPRAGFSNPFANPFGVPYGNMAPLPGAFPQQGFPGMPYSGFNPYQQFNPLGINPLWNQPYPWQLLGPQGYYSTTGGSGDNNGGGNGGGNGKEPPEDIPNIVGHWAGTWEAWATDPNGVITDPNTDQIVISMSGDIRFHVTQQLSSGNILGKIEITGWNVDPAPADWTGDWTGESNEIQLTGWIDLNSRYLKAAYYYYVGKEGSGSFDASQDLANLKGQFIWNFNSNKLKITDTGISGQFNIMGYNYYVTGTFTTGKYKPQ